jgi:RES domain-containing protein
VKKPSELRGVLTKVQGRSSQGLYYRVIRPKYMNGPLSTKGSVVTGGRYNPKDDFGVLYFAEDLVVGLAEVRMILQGMPEFTRQKPATRLILCVSVTISNVLDLRDEATMETLGTSLQELCGPWEQYDYAGKLAPTQQLGSAVFLVQSFQGILYPSAKDSSKHNLAVFPDRLGEKDSVEIADDDGMFAGKLP